MRERRIARLWVHQGGALPKIVLSEKSANAAAAIGRALEAPAALQVQTLAGSRQPSIFRSSDGRYGSRAEREQLKESRSAGGHWHAMTNRAEVASQRKK
jgi:hypothetical protein